MFWRRKKPLPPTPDPASCGHVLYEFLLASLGDQRGVRVEDFVSACATIVGERCIAVAGDFPVRTHTMAPGSRVFSTRINELLCGDSESDDLRAVPSESVFGLLRDRLTTGKYLVSEFPSLKAIFELFAASVGNADEWGKAPLSVPEQHRPFLLPLRVAYNTRKKVDLFYEPLGADPALHLRASVLALAEALYDVADAIDHKLVLLLAFETINGMGKTAPMTDAAMVAAAKS
jgi:hypothetical protein